MSKILLVFLYLFVSTKIVMGINIISKLGWGGAEAIEKTPLPNNLTYVIISHTVTKYCFNKQSCSKNMQQMQYYHQKSLGWNDIGYNFVIGGDGNIYEGRGWNTLGAFARGWNSRSIGIGFIGNYNNDELNAKQIYAAKELLNYAVAGEKLTSEYTLYAHCQVSNTLSPGNNLFREIQTWPHWKP